MDRRRFLSFSAGAISMGYCQAAARSEAAEGAVKAVPSPSKVTIDAARSVVEEAPRQTPVADSVDVLVVGGGPTGVGAALAAAGEGAKTLVVERHGMLGGMWTAGLLNPLFEPLRGWWVERLVERLQQSGGWRDHPKFPVFDTEVLKYTLEQMFGESGVDFWYHVQATDPLVIDGRVCGILIEGKSGREAVLAGTVIDCTGDGDIAARAGVPFQFGRPVDGLAQPMTMMFEVEGVESLGPETQNILKILTDAIEANHLPIRLPYGKRPRGAPYLIPPPAKGIGAVQATHVYRYNATDTRDLTRATVEARAQVHEIFLKALRKVPGIEKMRLAQTAPSLGIRESRHMEGRYLLNAEDVMAGRRFDDAVVSCAFGCDIHEIYPDDQLAHRIPAKPFEIPYRCLVPKSVRGLLFAGRCISGSHEAHASYRVTGTCMGLGQAAGLAAAMATTARTTPDEIDGRELRAALEKRGVKFL
ncbi:MAG: FAD-dependent oxidoreductase [Planctomycetaceae bacterium]|nr:FAD-dependent oxidoreductase [Planctomycetaceae bacterium]